MRSLEREAVNRPATVADWITELDDAFQSVSTDETPGKSRVIIMAPAGSEVYVNDERKGSVGSSGKIILTTVPAGNHILRVSKIGEKDDERMIEIRDDGNEQVIQAQLKPQNTGSQPSPSQGSSRGGQTSSLLPGIVACTRCNSRFAEGAKFCGRCGSSSFTLISPGQMPNNTSCPRCAASLPANAKFCGRCGFSHTSNLQNPATQKPAFNPQTSSNNLQTVEKICPRCGAVFPPHIKFCGRCGTHL